MKKRVLMLLCATVICLALVLCILYGMQGKKADKESAFPQKGLENNEQQFEDPADNEVDFGDSEAAKEEKSSGETSESDVEKKNSGETSGSTGEMEISGETSGNTKGEESSDKNSGDTENSGNTSNDETEWTGYY